MGGAVICPFVSFYERQARYSGLENSEIRRSVSLLEGELSAVGLPRHPILQVRVARCYPFIALRKARTSRSRPAGLSPTVSIMWTVPGFRPMDRMTL